MTFLTILVCGLWDSILMVGELPLAWLPDMALAMSVVVGFGGRGRSWTTALAAGAMSGVFTVEAWALKPCFCLFAYLVTSILIPHASKTNGGRFMVALLALSMAAMAEMLWRVSTASFTLSTVVELTTRAWLSAVVALLIESLLSRR